MKNTLKLALTASLFCIGLNAHAGNEQDTSEAAKRLKAIDTVFAERGEGAFASLNGIGTMSSMGGKGREAEDLATAGATTNFNDPNAELICIDGKDMFVVHTSQPTLVNTSAVEGANIWRDADGHAVVGTIRAALSRGNHGGLTEVDYTQRSDAENNLQNPRTGKPVTENVHLVVADSRFIKGLPEGAICATEGQLIGKDLDDSDANRQGTKDTGMGKKGKDGDPTKPGLPGEHHHKKKHHHHAKKAKAEAKDAKAPEAAPAS